MTPIYGSRFEIKSVNEKTKQRENQRIDFRTIWLSLFEITPGTSIFNLMKKRKFRPLERDTSHKYISGENNEFMREIKMVDRWGWTLDELNEIVELSVADILTISCCNATGTCVESFNTCAYPDAFWQEISLDRQIMILQNMYKTKLRVFDVVPLLDHQIGNDSFPSNVATLDVLVQEVLKNSKEKFIKEEFERF